MLFTSLPLKMAQSKIGAPVVSRATRPLLYRPTHLCVTSPHCWSRCHFPPTSDLFLPPPHRCSPPLRSARRRQHSTLAFVVKSLILSFQSHLTADDYTHVLEKNIQTPSGKVQRHVTTALFCRCRKLHSSSILAGP